MQTSRISALASWQHGSHDSRFWRDSISLDSPLECVIADLASWIFSPQRDRLRLSECGDHKRVGAIYRLFFGCGESAVFWRVWAVVIAALNRKFSLISICQRPSGKLTKRIEPLCADPNPTSAPIGEIPCMRFVASGNHALPNFTQPSSVRMYSSHGSFSGRLRSGFKMLGSHPISFLDRLVRAGLSVHALNRLAPSILDLSTVKVNSFQPEVC
jgi:hypothetical protein